MPAGPAFAAATAEPAALRALRATLRAEPAGGVEAGDSGKMVLSSPELLAGRRVDEIGWYPATFHVRDFLDCVKTRGLTKGNALAACNAHIACHAANIALHLDRQVKYDNVAHEFIDDVQANRLRSEALREPWRL